MLCFDKIHVLYLYFSNINGMYVCLYVGVLYEHIIAQISSVGLWHWMQGHNQVMGHLTSWTLEMSDLDDDCTISLISYNPFVPL